MLAPDAHPHELPARQAAHLEKAHVIGNVNQRALLDLWLDPEYLAYRERLHNFIFAPCTFCGGCDLSETNEEDCLGNDIARSAAGVCGRRASSSVREFCNNQSSCPEKSGLFYCTGIFPKSNPCR
jgi:predicted metal-binding protein